MLFMIGERFRDGAPEIPRRVREGGRGADGAP
jgi:hypothetical protein